MIAALSMEDVSVYKVLGRFVIDSALKWYDHVLPFRQKLPNDFVFF